MRNLSATNESVQRYVEYVETNSATTRSQSRSMKNSSSLPILCLPPFFCGFSEITKKAIVELQSQGTRRQKKISEDQVEIKYLETMVEKGGKRGKGRFNKLLNQMHPNRHLKPGDPVSNSQKPIAAVVGDKTISKKRKRKNLACDRVAKKNSDANGALPIDASDNLAPHIAAIIWKHDNQALIDDIVKEFLERVPLLAGDVKEARRRITNCMSFSRKPYRFRKLPDGITYSASRV